MVVRPACFFYSDVPTPQSIKDLAEAKAEESQEGLLTLCITLCSM